MDSTQIAKAFASLLGARVVTAPTRTPEQLAAIRLYDANLAATSGAALIAMWDAGEMDGDGPFCCDDVHAELNRRGLRNHCII